MDKIKSFDDLDALILEFGQIEARLAKAEASMNERIQKIREAFKTSNESDMNKRADLQKVIETFCISNKNEFQKIRSRDFTHGSVGFKFNPPKIAQLNRKYSVATSIELLKRVFQMLYIRTKEEINKEALLADYAAKAINDEKLASVGLKVDQDETFYIEPKWELIEDKKAS